MENKQSNESAPTKEEPTAAQLLTQAGNQYYQLESFDQALEKFVEAINEKGDKADEQDYTNAAAAFIENNKLDEAIDYCKMAIKINPKFIESYMLQAKVMSYKGKIPAAMDILKQALSKDKENKNIKACIESLETEIQLDKAVPKDNPKRQAMNRHLDWLKGQGCKFESLKINMVTVDQTIVLASRDIHKTEPICFIPEKLITTCEMVLDVPANSWLQWNPKTQAKIYNKEINCMALWYLNEKKKEKNNNIRMFEALRQDNTQCTTLWGDEEYDVIKGSLMEVNILQKNGQIEQDYNVIMKEVENLEGTFTLREYQEAWTMMELNIENMIIDKKPTCGFVPMIPYFMYNDDSQTFCTYDDDLKGYMVIAKKLIPRGSSISISLPVAHNNYCLIKKGFMNPIRETIIPIIVRLDQSDPLFAEKCSLTNNKWNARQFDVSNQMNTEQFQNLIFYLRYYMFSGSKEELVLLKKNEIDRKLQNGITFNNDTAFDGTKVPSFNGQSEGYIWAFILEYVENLLTKYAIPFEQCEARCLKMMDNSEPMKNKSQRSAWTYLNLEQGQLNGIRKKAHLFIGLLRASWETFSEACENNELVKGKYKDYVASSIYPHQQDMKMMKDGVQPPQRWAAPGQEDNTYSKIDGDNIIFASQNQEQAHAQMQAQIAAQQQAQAQAQAAAGAAPTESEVQQLPGQSEQDPNLGGMM